MDLLGKPGYADYPERIPPGWRIAPSDRWPINNPEPALPADFDIRNWRFRTLGEVDRPLDLTYDEFRKLPHVTKILDHHCVDGWSFLGQSWEGVDLSVLKELSEVRSSAKFVMIEGGKSLSQRFPVDQDLLLADGQNGKELTKAAGYPLRLVAPGEYGFKSRKWIDALRFCAEEEIDGLEESFKEIGTYDFYREKVGPLSPWTVNNNDRKYFLRQVFAAETEQARQSKKRVHLERGRETIQPGPNQEEVELCSTFSLRTRGQKMIVNGSEILLVQSSEGIRAIEPICTHLGTDLSSGKVNPDAQTIKCPLHGAVFDLASGICLNGSYGSEGDTFPGVRTYAVSIKKDRVFLLRSQSWGNVW